MTETVNRPGRCPGLLFRHGVLLLLLLLAVAAIGAPDIFEAVQRGDLKLVRHILDDPTPPVRLCNDDGRTALHLAADGGYTNIVSALLDAGADGMARDGDGLTPLHCAARQGDAALCTLLLNRKAEVNARDDQGWTPLHWAISMRKLDAAQVLLARGASAATRDTAGITPLHWAAANGQRAAMTLLLDHGAKINATDADGTTPLQWAAAGGQQAIAQVLLTAGADPLLRDRQGRTALTIADELGLAEMAGLLRPVELAAAQKTPLVDALPQFVAPDTLAAVDDAPRKAQPAKLSTVPNPLSSQATALYATNGNLYLGLSTGGVVQVDPADLDSGTLIAPPSPASTVRAVTTGGGAVWWLTARPALLCAYRPDSRTVTAYAAGELRPGSPLGSDMSDVPSLSWWRGRLVMSTRTGAYALDAKTGALHSLLGLLPEQIAGAARGARLFFAAQGESAVLTALRPNAKAWTATTWRTTGAAWSSAGLQDVPQWNGVTAVGSRGLGLIGGSQFTDLPAATGVTASLSYLTYNARVPAPRWAASGGDYHWWGGGDVFFHAAPDRAEVYAYLPWNDPGVSVRCAAADADGVWLATNHGVRRVVPGQPTALGYAGFIRLRLGSEAEQPQTEQDRRLAAAVESWQGTPYAWGGSSRNGTDCSGFVMAMHQVCGIAIPHGSANLRVCPTGELIRDELRYGDVLVYPGHAALYIGNGRTAETVANQGVGKSTIWFRRSTVVRRFLNLPPRNPVQLASRSGDRNTAAKRKAAAAKRK